jgi:hypothetical protein
MAIEKLLQTFNQVIGNLSLGGFDGWIYNGEIFLIMPCGDATLAKRIDENAESGSAHKCTNISGQVYKSVQEFSTCDLEQLERMHPSPNMAVSPLRAWYSGSVSDFVGSPADLIFGQLAKHSEFGMAQAQGNAWNEQIEFLQSSLKGLDGALFLEFNIPRMGRRIDAVLLIGPVVFVVEFKTGESELENAALEQVWDYALDLKNFHEGSHGAVLIPVAIATNARGCPEINFVADADHVYHPIQATKETFRSTIDFALQRVEGSALNEKQWGQSSYHPTPTIVEAARALYAHHSVEAIHTFDAGKRNLRVTSKRIEELVDQARKSGRKIICFVTGVPGAGKTLVGLNIATRRRERKEPTHAVFLSGNGPLVAVLCEALTRDEVQRRKINGEKVRKKAVAESVKAFIQNVHHFRDEALVDKGPPVDHVVIFDEAQRAWNHQQTESFMRRKKNRANFAHSEPEFLISYLDRHKDWAAIICLVGGGQEINIGEAGIHTWIEAVNTSFPHWHMYISSNMTDSEYAADRALEVVEHRRDTHFDDSLHLAVSMRSFRAEHVSAFVKALLDCEKKDASETFTKISGRYPIALTRDLATAKNWIRTRARGSERYGLVASSKAQRLKPHAIDVRVDVDPVHWFLNGKLDTRSSFYLEDAATEFQVQGLELDWACVTWDGDLRITNTGWTYHDFRGAEWTNVKKSENKNYLRNAYRVLLTRARQGMVIFVPKGDGTDPTRSPAYYDSTFDYLAEIGIPILSASE